MTQKSQQCQVLHRRRARMVLLFGGEAHSFDSLPGLPLWVISRHCNSGRLDGWFRGKRTINPAPGVAYLTSALRPIADIGLVLGEKEGY